MLVTRMFKLYVPNNQWLKMCFVYLCKSTVCKRIFNHTHTHVHTHVRVRTRAEVQIPIHPELLWNEALQKRSCPSRYIADEGGYTDRQVYGGVVNCPTMYLTFRCVLVW